MFLIHYSNQAEKFLKKCEKIVSKRIITKIEKLSINPFPSNMKKLKNKNVFRHRIGDYRALYLLKEKEKIILITKIGKRPRVYG